MTPKLSRWIARVMQLDALELQPKALRLAALELRRNVKAEVETLFLVLAELLEAVADVLENLLSPSEGV